MLRVVVLAAIVLMCLVLVVQLIGSVRARRVDWGGIGFMAAFVALAFYLRHASGLG